MSSRRLVAAALAAALTLTAAACGDDGDAGPVVGDDAATDGEATELDDGHPATTFAIDACELVTEADAEAAMGGEVDLSATTDEPLSCVYDASASGELTLAIVQVTVEPGGLAGVELEQMAGMVAGFADEGAEPEPVDLGDGAFLVAEGPVPMLFVAAGEDLLTFSVMGSEDDGAAMVALGEAAVGRL